MADDGSYRHLLSPLRIRNTTLPNRVIFGPVCPTWVRSPHEGIFTEQAVAYYEERAKTGLGMIILGGHLINKDTIYTPLGFPGLWNDAQLEGLANVARAVKRHGCALAVQLLHLGLRSPTPFLKTDPARDPDEYNPYMLAPSQVPAGEIPGGPTPKELEEHEIEYILQCYEDAARRAISAGLDGIEFHIAHGYLPWQFLSPFYNKRTDRWGGSYENRLRFSVEAMRRIRKRIGDRPFLGYRNQLNLVLGRRSRDRRRQARSRRFREGARYRLCERVGRRSSLLDSHADDFRGGLGARIYARHQDGREEAGTACGPRQSSRSRRRAHRLW